MYDDALTTKTRVKLRLSITATTFDDLFDNLIIAVSKQISQICGRRFMQGTYEDELHDGSDEYGTGRSVLIVKNAPIASIASIEYNTGSRSNPVWTEFSEDFYDVNYTIGTIYFDWDLPPGRRNIRITYTGGYSGYSIGVMNYWVFNQVPPETPNGSLLTFSLPEAATELIVYGDGARELSSNIDFTSGDDEFSFVAGRAPGSAVAFDYLPGTVSDDTETWLPPDLVEVCEEVVVRLFKRREAEGRASESFNQSSITWNTNVFTEENMATVKNYRRGYNL